MCALLRSAQIGDSLNFKHIEFNVKKQYNTFNKENLCIIAGGTGITPMVQALHAVLGNPEDNTKVTMLYGSRTEADILARETLDSWQAAHPEQLSVVNVLSDEPEGSSWTGERGFVNEALLKANFPGPEADPLIFVCGPPAMYDALCGARDRPDELTGTLEKLGYKAKGVVKF